MKNKPKIQFCKKCTYPSSSAIPLQFDENGICSGCNTNSQANEIDWDRRKMIFENILDDINLLIMVMIVLYLFGGKDSYCKFL